MALTRGDMDNGQTDNDKNTIQCYIDKRHFAVVEIVNFCGVHKRKGKV